MYRPLSMLRLSPQRIDPEARQRSLDAVAAYYKAQKELERICAEKGIQVPVLVC